MSMKIRFSEEDHSFPPEEELKLRTTEGKDVTLKDLADLNLPITIIPLSYDAATDSVAVNHPYAW